MLFRALQFLRSDKDVFGVLLAIQIVACVIAAALLGALVFTVLMSKRVERLVPLAGRLIELPSGPLHVVEMGVPTAPPVLLIHGLGGQLRNLTYGLAPLLASDFHILAVDRPGSGYSPRRPARDFLAAQAKQLAELIEVRELQQTFVVGHSLGGAVALELAHLHPDLVTGLALLSPAVTTQAVPDVFQALMIKNSLLRMVVAWTLAVPLTFLRRERVAIQLFRPEPVPGDFGTKAGALLGLRPGAFLEASEELVSLMSRADHDFHRRLAPTMVVGALFATDDAVIDPHIQSQGLAKSAPQSTIEYLAGAGHLLPITRSGECAAFVGSVYRRSKEPRSIGNPDAPIEARPTP